MLGLAAAALLTACTGSDSTPTPAPDPSQVVESLGAVPIPSAAAAEPTESASPGHPAVLAIGGPVKVTLPGGGRGLITVSGPRQTVTNPSRLPDGRYPNHTRAVITLKLVMQSGSATITTSELTSRDESGHLINLKAVGATSHQVSAGASASVQVIGTFTRGAAQVTWTHEKKVLGIWTFNIELD